MCSDMEFVGADLIFLRLMTFVAQYCCFDFVARKSGENVYFNTNIAMLELLLNITIQFFFFAQPVMKVFRQQLLS